VAEYKPFIIATGDMVAEFVDNNKKKLEPLFHITGTAEQGLLTRVLDKNYMCKIAARIGFNVPASRQFKWDSDISGIIYPCLLKPDKSHLTHKKDFKTRVCYSETELKETLKTVSKESVFVLQEFIQKDADLLIYGCRTNSGKTIVAGTLIKKRWDEKGDGSYGYLTDEKPESIRIELIERFLCEINYTGLFSVEYALKGDTAYFMEFNLRNDGTSHYFYQAGVNIPMIWILDTLGIDYTYLIQSVHGRKIFMSITDDYINVKNGVLSKSDWKKERDEATVFRYKDKQDIAPHYWHIAMEKLIWAYSIIRKIIYK
jgi:predicted ATP-grasp superfamily ATP-dependent carboligase